ncbi:hypothetical protein ACHWQZ_G004159 [Mnemiopsis leidyi]
MIVYDYNNRTKFGMSDKERHVYAGWMIIVVTCSMAGDAIVLISSIKYGAFRLPRPVVTFIQHIAAADFIASLTKGLPIIISTLVNGVAFNDISFTYFSFFMGYYIFTVSPFLITAMALIKYILIKYPFKTMTWSSIHVHRLCAGIWISSIFTPLLHLLVDPSDITFDYRVYTHMYGYTSHIWKVLLPATSFLVLAASSIIILFSSGLLLKEARQVQFRPGESLRAAGIITVLLSAVIYSISYLPLAIYFIAEPFVVKDPGVPGPFFLGFYRVGFAFLYFNVIGNFFVYVITVKSFRRFLRRRLRKVVEILTGEETSQPDGGLSRVNTYVSEFDDHRRGTKISLFTSRRASDKNWTT